MTTFRCQVILLDGSIIERYLEIKAVGQVLFNKVCEYLNLLETDYFGLAVWDSSNNKVWLDLSKRVHKQIISHDATFTFGVKFYPPKPSLLAEDITRYLLCLQLRTDILTSRLPCSSDMLAVLGSYTIQSEFGDYNPELHGKEFYSNIPLAPNQTPELEEEVAALHHRLKSMSPAQADQLFLQNVKTLHMYGVHLHTAKDASGGDVMLGVCADGLVVYEDEENTHRFIWPAVLNMTYKRNIFQARILHSEDTSETNIKFTLPSYQSCKCLWRNAVEHHAFFRDLENQGKAPKRLRSLGFGFRFSGPTHAESLEASSTIEREAPKFARSAIKRKAKDSLVALKRPNRTDFVDWFQVLGSDEPWPIYSPDVHTDKYQLTAEETLAYKERQEVDEVDNEWFQLFGGRFVPTQNSFSSVSSDTDILESTKFQLWKLQPDDWFALLEPQTYPPIYWHQNTRPYSVQFSQDEDQREGLEWMEQHSGKNIKIVQIRDDVQAVTEQYEEMERNLIRADMGVNLELEIGENEQRLKGIRERIVGQGDGEEFQTVVMYEQRMQEVEPYTGQDEVYFKRRIKETEVVDTVHELMLETSQVVTEEAIKELEETLLEVERIEQKLQDIERLKVKLQEVEMLEQKLHKVQQEGRRRDESDDWYILLEHKPMASTGPVRQIGMKTGTKPKKQGQGDRDRDRDRGDWYLWLDHKSSVVSSAKAAIDVQSSWVNVVEKHKNGDKETLLAEERELHKAELQPTFPVHREEQTQKEVDDDWFIQLSLSPKHPVLATTVYKEAGEEEVQLVKKQIDMITYEEERREMIETTPEVVRMNPIPFEKRAVPTGPTVYMSEQKAEIRQSIEEALQKANPLPVQMTDDWYILLDSLPRSTQTTQPALSPSVAIDVQSPWVNVVEKHKNGDKETLLAEESELHKAELQPTFPVHREEQTQKEVDDDWFIQLSLSPKHPVLATTVYKEAGEEEVQSVKKQIDMITYEEERREMIETTPEVVRMNPIPFEKRAVPTVLATAVEIYKETIEKEVQLVAKHVETIPYEEERREIIETSHDVVETHSISFEKRAVPSAPSVDTAVQKAAIRQWTEDKRQRAITPVPVQMKDDWYILLDSLPRSTQTTQPALSPSELQKRAVPSERPRSRQTVKIKEEVTFEKKPMIIKEKQVIVGGVGGKITATAHDDDDDEDSWFVLFTPVKIDKATTTGVSETWIQKEKRLKEVQKGRLREDVKTSYVMEDKRLHLYVPEPKARVRHTDGIDDWFLRLEPVSKKSVSVEKRVEEDRRRKEELFKKQVLAEDRKKVAVPVMPLTPAVQPMTSTPTAQSVRITRPAYHEESLKTLDITQDMTQDLKKEAEVETESTIKTKRKEKRIERESIYIRHSILMLEDSDMTQEIILKHHSSVSELKRIFMEDIPVFGPTEWDRRLSSYTPVIYPKLSNGALFTGINIIERSDGLVAM